MRRYFAWGFAFVVCTPWVACSSSGDDAGGPSGTLDAGADATFGTNACFSCISAACAAYAACSADPGCGAYLTCVKGCGTNPDGSVSAACEAQCFANAAQGQLTSSGRDCILTGSGCAECGVSVAEAGPDAPAETGSPNPALHQICDPQTNDDKCVECVLNHCCDSADEILGNGPGALLNDCMNTCDDPLTYDDCQYACVQAHPDGAPGYGGWFSCYGTLCSATDACTAPDACTDCLFTTCDEETADCYTDSDCLLLYMCTGACEDAECGVACLSEYPAGQKAFGDLLECTKACPC